MKGFFMERDASQLFTLEDLIKPNFFDDMVYLDYWHSSGLGGPGVVYIIMKDSSSYQIGLGTGFPYEDESRLGEYIPLLDRKKRLPDGWKRWKEKETFIREDYFQDYERLYKELNLDDEDVIFHQLVALKNFLNVIREIIIFLKILTRRNCVLIKKEGRMRKLVRKLD